MKKIIITMAIACLAITGLASPTRAEPNTPEAVTADVALTVCQNWVTLITLKAGSWGGVQNAKVQGVQEFKRGQRVLGYFCAVKPQGYIVVSLRQELEPVKVYSATSDLNPELDLGMTDLIKGRMERILDTIEQRLGPIRMVRTQDLNSLLEINYRSTWNQLAGNPNVFRQALESKQVMANYQGGQVMLLSVWRQDNPFNSFTPAGDTACTLCGTPPNTYAPTSPTLVGCVATAGAQIMRYWAWPPYGIGSSSYSWSGDDSCGGNASGGTLSATYSDAYDWRNMANEYVWDTGQNRWEDENGNPLTQAQLDAVAELSYEVGGAVRMDYGVCTSGAYTSDMESVYENYFRYSTAATRRNRPAYTAIAWFDRMKTQFNANRPVHYRIKGHSIVGDGWQETGSGTDCNNGILCQYHMNYGWGQVGTCQNGCNTWYTLDALHQPDPTGTTNDEYMLEDIYPAQALGSSLSSTYARDASFPYRYFDKDATGDTVAFQSGQFLQFLPGITVRGTSTTGGAIRFESSTSDNTRLFTRGDTSKGILISGGAVKLYQNGSIRFAR
jgi:hypothetical protein